MKTILTLDPGHLTLSTLRTIWQEATAIALPPSAYPAIAASAATIDRIVARGEPAYGINTGFGKLAKTHIPDEQLELLQRNLILSHSVGTGAAIDDNIVRLIMAMKIQQPGARLFRHPRARDRHHDCALQRRHHAVHPLSLIHI